MKLTYYKKIRVVVSLLFFIPILILFLDFKNIFSSTAVNYLLYLQFAPSLIKFITILGIGAAGFIVVFILTLLFGRVYCSSICPLGTLQDIITYFSKKFSKKKKKKKFFDYEKPYNLLRYSLMGLTIIVLLTGSAFLVNLLDPYSNFGRISTNIFKPVVVHGNNLVSRFLESWEIYAVYPTEPRQLSIIAVAFPVLILGLVLWLAIKKGRLYCNTVCPVGTFLGWFSKYSMFRISINDAQCNSCGLCEYNCKASCIDKEAQKIDHSRCVSCYNCFTSCNKEAIKYNFAWSRNKTKEIQFVEPDLKKRGFVAGSMVLLLALFGFKPRKDTTTIKSKEIVPTKLSTVPEDKKFAVSPPGSKTIRMYNDKCTACHLCVSACPDNVLQPSFLQYGLIGMMQPHMDYHSGYCNFDCKICTDICPTGAILPLELEDKKLVQLGKAKFIKENCIVETERTDCGACSEHCPTKAVDMVPFEEGLFIPEVNEDICIGCGACEYACPTVPYKAIFVDGNPEHLTAEKPVQEELDTDIDYEEDFPF